MAASLAVLSLDDDIKNLIPLDDRRMQFEKWRAEGREALKLYAAANGTLRDWIPPKDIGDRALVVKALCRPGESGTFELMLDSLKNHPKEAIFGNPAATKPDEKLSVFAKEQGVPLLDVALALSALASAPSQTFTPTTMWLHYVVIRELYQPSAPRWVVGGARAGADGRPTAFITSEFVRAILSFSRMLERTGAYAGALAEMSRRRQTSIKAWNDEDAKRRALSLYTTLAQRSWNLAIPLDRGEAVIHSLSETDIAAFEKEIVARLIKSLDTSVTTFAQAYADAQEFREREETEANVAGEHSREFILCERSASAHRIALRALKDAHERAVKTRKIFDPALVADDSARLEEMEKAFRDAAKQVRKLTLPAQDFLSGVLDTELSIAAGTSGARFEPAEMASAAAALGAARRWDDERIVRAGELLAEALNPEGFAISRPYHTRDTRYYNPTVAPIVGAFCQIVEHVPSVNLTEAMVGRIARVVENGRRPIDDKQSSWRSRTDATTKLHSAFVTAISTLALDRVCRMLDQRINDTVLRHFTVKHFEAQLSGPELHELFYPDYGLMAAETASPNNGSRRASVSVSLERMRAHVAGVELKNYDDVLYSVVLHGPPGTGKTTLIEGLATSARVPLVEVTPSDIVVRGSDAVEAQARAVLKALSLLTRAVVLFDEFDPVLRSRGKADEETQTIFNFLTPSMLPKLKTLYESAKKRRVAYALITNVIRRLDVAAIRSGRFDAAIGVYAPDYLSRAGRLETEVTAYLQENSKVAAPADLKKRLDEVVKATALAPMQYIGKRGWFTRPKKGAELKLSTAFGYLFASNPAAKMPPVPKADAWDDAMLSDKERADLTEIQKLEPPAVEFSRTP